MKDYEQNLGHYEEKLEGFKIPDVMNEELYLKIKKGIAELQGLDLEDIDIKDDSVFTEPKEKGGLGADSLARVEIVMKIEDILAEDYKEEFEKGIPDDQAELVGRVKHVRELFNVRMAARQNPKILDLWMERRRKEIEEYNAQKRQK